MKNFLLFDLFILFDYYFIIEICCKNKIKADKDNNILLNKKYYNKYDDNNILKNIFFNNNNNYLNILSEDNNLINYIQNSEEEEDSSSSEEYIFNIPVYLEDTKITFIYDNENKSLNFNYYIDPTKINPNSFIDNFKDIFEEKFNNIKNLILNLSNTNYSLNSFNSNNIDYIKKEENFISFESKNISNIDLSLELNGIIFEDPVFYLSYCPENCVNNKTIIDLLSYYSIFPKVFFDYFFNNFFNSKDECINTTKKDNNDTIYIKCLYNKILISTIHKKLYVILENYVFPYEKLFNENINNDIYFNIIFQDIDYIILGKSFFYNKKIGYIKNTSEILIYSKDIHNFSKFYKNLNNNTFKLFLYIVTISIISLLVIFFFIRFCYARYERKKEKISLELNQFSFEKKIN